MSAFLGPIHYWMYRKIQVQEAMVEAVLKQNETKGYIENLREQTNEHCGTIEQEPLETIIDESNIHGWLQARVQIVEKRLSYAVTEIIKHNAAHREEVVEIIHQLGKQMKPETEPTDAKAVFQLLNDMLLDGMPCDHINEQVSASEDEVVYRRTRCIHCDYWREIGGQEEVYYDLRTAFVKGMLENTTFEYRIDDQGNYHIKRK